MADRRMDVALRVRGGRAFLTEMKRSERGIRGLGSATGRANLRAEAGERAWRGLGTAVRTTGRWAGYGAIALGGAAATGVAAGVRLNAQWESVNASFATFLGSTEKAEAFTERLRTVSSKSPLRLTEYAEGARLLLGFGMRAKDTIPLLQSVNKAVVATGGGAEQMKSVVDVLGEMSARGRVFGEDLTRMVDAGMPVHKILQKELGLTSEQMARIGDEAISSDKAIQAIQEGWGKKYTKAYGNAEKTFAFQFSRSKKMFEQSLRLATEPVFELLKKEALPRANEEMEKFTAILSNDKLTGQQKFDAVKKQLSGLMDELGDAIDRSDIEKKLLAALEKATPEVLGWAVKAGGKAVGAFAKGWWNAPWWAKLFTGALIAGKIAGAMGAWTGLGSMAAGKFSKTFGRTTASTIATQTTASGWIGSGMVGSPAAKGRWGKLGKIAGRAFGIGLAAVVANEVRNILKDSPKWGQYSGEKGWGELGRDIGDWLPGEDSESKRRREQEAARRRGGRRRGRGIGGANTIGNRRRPRPGGANAIVGAGASRVRGPKRVALKPRGEGNGLVTVIDRTVHKVMLSDGRVLAEEVGRQNGDHKARR